jgi:hypothetical protein
VFELVIIDWRGLSAGIALSVDPFPVAESGRALVVVLGISAV